MEIYFVHQQNVHKLKEARKYSLCSFSRRLKSWWMSCTKRVRDICVSMYPRWSILKTGGYLVKTCSQKFCKVSFI